LRGEYYIYIYEKKIYKRQLLLKQAVRWCHSTVSSNVWHILINFLCKCVRSSSPELTWRYLSPLKIWLLVVRSGPNSYDFLLFKFDPTFWFLRLYSIIHIFFFDLYSIYIQLNLCWWEMMHGGRFSSLSIS